MEHFFGNHIAIENEKNYFPGKGIIPKGEQYIVALHLIRPLLGDIILTNLVNEKTTFPPTAFVSGGIYNFPTASIKYLNSSDNCAFVGCRFGYMPFQT